MATVRKSSEIWVVDAQFYKDALDLEFDVNWSETPRCLFDEIVMICKGMLIFTG